MRTIDSLRLAPTVVSLVLAGCMAGPGTSAPSPAASHAPSAQVVSWPRPMNNPTATWDPTSGLTLVAGDTGRGQGLELWGWDGVSWQQLDDGADAPFARDDTHLVADPTRGVVWLYGGRTQRGGGAVAHSDTWAWDGDAWSLAVPDGSSAAPPARIHPAVGWDAAQEQVILYGGIGTDDAFFSDTWSWDGRAWRQVAAGAPGGRRVQVAMAWDASAQRLALLTVDLASDPPDELYAGEVWTLDGDWSARAGGATPRFSPIQPMVGTDDGLVLVDGGLLQGASATWTWDGGAWTQAEGTGPSPRNGHALAFDAERGRVVLFGGYDGIRDTTDVWEWDGKSWSQFVAP